MAPSTFSAFQVTGTSTTIKTAPPRPSEEITTPPSVPQLEPACAPIAMALPSSRQTTDPSSETNRLPSSSPTGCSPASSREPPSTSWVLIWAIIPPRVSETCRSSNFFYKAISWRSITKMCFAGLLPGAEQFRKSAISSTKMLKTSLLSVQELLWRKYSIFSYMKKWMSWIPCRLSTRQIF